MMLPQPHIEFVSARNVELIDPWEIQTSAGLLHVKTGIISDGASIPRIFWRIPGFAPYEGDTLPAAFAHDCLYASELVDRKTADDIIYELLRENGVGYLRASMYWRAVRGFGGFVWRRHTAESIATAREYVILNPV